MDHEAASEVGCFQLHPVLSVQDLRQSVKFYTDTLGFRLGFMWGDPPNMAGIQLGDVSLHLRQGTPAAAGAAVYFVVEDIDDLYALHAKHGVAPAGPPTLKPWGLREYAIHDLDGYVLVFGQHEVAREPKIEVERVEVPVRIEKRLAALMTDLANYKGLSLSECLEETLLHSFERTGRGAVASPHNDRTLSHISELKQVHGIDYDTHASYRFAERPSAGRA